MKRTSAFENARNRSTKSEFIGELTAQAPELIAEAPGLDDARFRRQSRPEFTIGFDLLGNGSQKAAGGACQAIGGARLGG